LIRLVRFAISFLTCIVDLSKWMFRIFIFEIDFFFIKIIQIFTNQIFWSLIYFSLAFLYLIFITSFSMYYKSI
jgi:hypothetical protein